MDDLTFLEFLEEVGKGLWLLPGNLVRLIVQPKPLPGWILTCLITVCLLGFFFSVVSAIIHWPK